MSGLRRSGQLEQLCKLAEHRELHVLLFADPQENTVKPGEYTRTPRLDLLAVVPAGGEKPVAHARIGADPSAVDVAARQVFATLKRREAEAA